MFSDMRTGTMTLEEVDEEYKTVTDPRIHPGQDLFYLVREPITAGLRDPDFPFARSSSDLSL